MCTNGKICFISDRAKPAQEVIFPQETENITYPNLYFNSLSIVKIASRKYFGLNLDARLTLNNHENERNW